MTKKQRNLTSAAARSVSRREATALAGGFVKSSQERSVTQRSSTSHSTQPVTRTSERIIKEVSTRRRTAMKVLANR